MSLQKFQAYQTSTQVGTTALNAVASGSFAHTVEYDNSTNNYLFADLELALSAVVTSTGTPYITLYLLPNISGNYFVTSGDPGTGYMVSSLTVPAAANQRYFQFRNIQLTPNKFKIVLLNNLGVTLPATGNVLTLYPYNIVVA